jgi:signal transduction histidine kinase
MASSYNSQAAQERWQQFSATAVRAFHRYATWLVSLSWWRFGWYALLLIIVSGLLQKLPPFSATYYETIVEAARHRKAKVPAVPAPPASVATPPQPPTQPEQPAQPEKTTTTVQDGKASRTVDINLPGIVVNAKDRTARNKGVNITFSDNGIHISSDDGNDDAAHAASAASAAAQVASAAAARARATTAKAAASAAKAAEPAASGAAVDMVVGGQHIRINVPAHANADEVRDAIDEARDSIVQSVKDAEEARRAAEDAARDKADADKDVAKATHGDEASDDDGDDGDTTVEADGQRRTMHERTVNQIPVKLLAVWWILGSILIKVTYKGRIQAEVKAAVATEAAEAESLRRQVLEARMAMMQAQVEPHFLFNTLASIDHLIEFDPKRASQMQRNLISLLRASMPSMRSTDSGLRPLDLELAVVRPYLEILKVRMEERLTTEIDVPDGLLSAEFPPMMIQTLVENSIKHGLEPKAEGGHLSVKAEIRHGKLAVTVCDTGLGFEAAAQGSTHGTGVGLANIRERLALLYGTKASLTIANNPVGGTIVTITVPYTAHTDSSSDPGAKA